MISLHSKNADFLNWSEKAEPIILPVTENVNLPRVLAQKKALLIDSPNKADNKLLHNFGALIFRSEVADTDYNNVIVLPQELYYLASQDIIRINPFANEIRTLFRSDSEHNSILVTERCNSFCLMCSQPPRDIDDSYLIEDACDLIKMIPRGTQSLGITGGEPTILAEGFLRIVRTAARFLPETPLHILTNGRSFQNRDNSLALKKIDHPNLMLGIPLYSDLPEKHDFVVQANNAFEETVQGMLNLRQDGIPIEIRVVIHKQTFSRLPQLARFIVRNLAFVEHVAFMGLELTGFTKANFGALWIDPFDYQDQLEEACRILQTAGITTMIYNHQLCILSPYTRRFSVNSISDWKNEYLDICSNCARKSECGGFFSTGFSLTKHSQHINPFINGNNEIPIRELTV